MSRKNKRLMVAIGQIPIVMGQKEKNLATIFQTIEQAGRLGADLIVLPECSLTGWLSPAARSEAEPLPGPLTKRLGQLARRYRLGIVVGLEEKAEGRIYNSAILIDRAGSLQAHHRKINELDIGLRLYSRGDRLNVAEFDGWRVGLNICADSWTPQIIDTLSLMGAEIVFSPCAWAIDPGKEQENINWISRVYRSRTRQKDLLIVSANGVGAVTQGPWRGRILQGNSLVFGPRGRKVLQGPMNVPELLVHEITADHVVG